MNRTIIALALLVSSPWPALAFAKTTPGKVSKTTYPNAYAAAQAGAADAISHYTGTKTTASDVTGFLLKKTAKTQTWNMNDGDNNQVKQSVLELKSGEWKEYHTFNVTPGQ